MRRDRPLPLTASLAAVALALSALTGCGRGVGGATGRVTHQGKPVVCGAVVFVGPDGMTKTAALQPDGSYHIRGVGAGRVQVAVVSEDPARPLDPYKAAKTHGKAATDPVEDSARGPGAGRAVAPAPADRSNWAEPSVDRTKWFPLPKKYELVSTSGLAVELKAGSNTGVDIELP